jgi:hypothetical protein
MMIRMSATNLSATVGPGATPEEEAATPVKADRTGRIRLEPAQREKLRGSLRAKRHGRGGLRTARRSEVSDLHRLGVQAQAGRRARQPPATRRKFELGVAARVR